MRVGGLVNDVTPEFMAQLHDFLKIIDERIEEYAYLLGPNEIFEKRTKGIGMLTREEIVDFGVSGPVARAACIQLGCPAKSNPYSGYEKYEFDVPIGTAGDVLCDRGYLVRMEEMRQSGAHPETGRRRPARRPHSLPRPQDQPAAAQKNWRPRWKP